MRRMRVLCRGACAGLCAARLPATALTPLGLRSERELSVADRRSAEFLGAAGLRDPAALRRRDGRRHLPSGDGPARARARAVARRLCAALAPAGRRPLWREPQPAAALLPVPGDPEAGAGRHPGALSGSLAAIGIDPAPHDIRFVEDDWESPTLGAWGLGWEVWCDGMEVSQFTYFQQVGGIDCDPVSAELTYGLERLAMYVQGVESIFDLDFNDSEPARMTYGDVFQRAEREFSAYNFEIADTEMLIRHFEDAERECARSCANAAWRCRPMTSAEGQPSVQSAGCARRDQRDRARRLHRARARPGQRLLRSLAGGAEDGGGRSPAGPPNSPWFASVLANDFMPLVGLDGKMTRIDESPSHQRSAVRRIAARTVLRRDPGAHAAARDEDLTGLLRDKLAAAEIAGGRHARLCDAAAAGRHRRRHSRSPAGPQRGAERPARRRAGSGDRRLPALGRARLDRRMRDPRHRPRRILFRGRPAAGPARRRGAAASWSRPRSPSCPGRNRCAGRARRCAGCGR